MQLGQQVSKRNEWMLLQRIGKLVCHRLCRVHQKEGKTLLSE